MTDEYIFKSWDFIFFINCYVMSLNFNEEKYGKENQKVVNLHVKILVSRLHMR